MSDYLKLLAKNVPPMPEEHLLKFNSEQLRAYEKSRKQLKDKGDGKEQST
jgi:hypothetical protein